MPVIEQKIREGGLSQITPIPLETRLAGERAHQEENAFPTGQRACGLNQQIIGGNAQAGFSANQ